MLTPTQLAGVAPPTQNPPALANGTEQFRIRGFPPRAVETEPLSSNRMAVLQPTKTRLERLAAGQLRQLPGDKLGIVPGFFQPHAQMLTGAFGFAAPGLHLRPQTLSNPEILWRYFQQRIADPLPGRHRPLQPPRSEEHTSELQSRPH